MIGLACSTVSCDGTGDNHFVRTFDTAPQVGFRYVEFNCWHPGDLTPQNLERIIKRSAETNLTPIAVWSIPFGGSNSFELSKDVGHKLWMIEAACRLGCRRIVANGGPRGKLGGLDGVITALREVIPVAEAKGILICLENHANNNLENIDDYDRVFSAIASPCVGMCVDTGHFDAANVDLDAVIDRFASRINHIHVKEARAKGVAEFVRFGEGVTDNRRVVERLLARGYQGYISVELAIQDKSNLHHDLRVPYDLFSRYERP